MKFKLKRFLDLSQNYLHCQKLDTFRSYSQRFFLEIGYRVMTRNLRSKRTAESRTTKSPEPKRQSTGPTDLIQQTRTARPKTAPGMII